MIRYRRFCVILAGLLTLLAAWQAWAGAPTDQLRGAIDRALKTLEDPSLKAPGKTGDRRSAVRKVANDIFDFAETAKRSLARHWQSRTDREREEFVVLFGDLLERSYISKIELYGGERIQYLGESLDSDQATVKTKIVTKQGTEVPVDYRMVKRGERWLVYDVSIEGVSLINNYRTQFNKIIQTSSYNDLVKKMKTKQAEFSFEEEAKAKGNDRKK
jgi:phospholipid transport system substrate-binding protein